jgi:hypothetical protein
MPARRWNVIAKARSRPGRGVEKLLFRLSVGERELFYTTSEPSVGEAVSFAYKTVPDPTMAAVAESHEASA